ncbi:hypothetical protein [Desulfurobacterium atlanticum]|uniref:Uncharacterized protein n=1 Tax=Desulfurobacterium atlanticum TaxID=240169 RepID=A0A238ZR83_9BACT|nr:hypothetical protein [Desulfurobacterium atlanticum]SNR85652.1 hypothetical protein SAMN06265340_1113 [Desulfurobacterium atlanticum]
MQEDLKKAERLARTVVADFFLYNQDKIDKALKEDTLFDLLSGELEDSEKFYNSNVSAAVRKSSNYFWDTLFNRLMKREAQLLDL